MSNRIFIFAFGLPACAVILQPQSMGNPQRHRPRDHQNNHRHQDFAGYVDVSTCAQNVTENMYGMWIDGRDAAKGMNAYGSGYHEPVQRSLQMVYDLGCDGPDANLDIFQNIVTIMKQGETSYEGWIRGYPSPIKYEVEPCHKDVPAHVVDQLMSTLTVVDKEYNQIYEMSGSVPPVYEVNNAYAVEQYNNVMAHLFANYSREVSGKPGREAELFSIAKLMQNLAFLHPFRDQNGRARLMLLQYMLRQRNLGCGTMMYNNNKNIYWETAENYAKLLEEGISIYREASDIAFSENPWQAEDTLTSHRSQFPPPEYMEKVEQCWNKMVGGGGVGTSPVSKKS